jgi:hypothetical protein
MLHFHRRTIEINQQIQQNSQTPPRAVTMLRIANAAPLVDRLLIASKLHVFQSPKQSCSSEIIGIERTVKGLS